MAPLRSRKSGKAEPHSRQNHSGSLGRPDRYIVRTERRYPLHAPEPARRGRLPVSGKSRGPGKSGDLASQSFCTTPPVHLSPRETEILRYVAAEHTTKEVAAALNIAESTG